MVSVGGVIARRLAPMMACALWSVAAFPVAAPAQTAAPSASELRLDADLVEDFLYVIYFINEGRLDLREHSKCSYQYLQNPKVVLEDGLVRVGAEYLARRGTEALGGCVGGPGTSTGVSMTARLSANGKSLSIEVLEVTTETLPELTGMLLGAVGVTVPVTHEFDMMGAMNRILYDSQPFGVSALEIHEAVVEDGSVLLRMTIKLGIW